MSSMRERTPSSRRCERRSSAVDWLFDGDGAVSADRWDGCIRGCVFFFAFLLATFLIAMSDHYVRPSEGPTNFSLLLLGPHCAECPTEPVIHYPDRRPLWQIRGMISN